VRDRRDAVTLLRRASGGRAVLDVIEDGIEGVLLVEPFPVQDRQVAAKPDHDDVGVLGHRAGRQLRGDVPQERDGGCAVAADTQHAVVLEIDQQGAVVVGADRHQRGQRRASAGCLVAWWGQRCVAVEDPGGVLVRGGEGRRQ